VEARRSFPYHSAYGASKHGIDGFLEAMRLELIHEGLSSINVTNVMPASINTPLFNKSRTKIGVKPQGLPPIYQPDIVVDAIVYAACHPTRNIIAGGAGRAMDLIERLSPKNWAERSGGLKPRPSLDGFSSTLRLLISSLSTSVLVLPTALQCSSRILNSDY
jgi:short-subunit dehydrogenase